MMLAGDRGASGSLGAEPPARTRGGNRTPITLACTECKGRNYRTTKNSDQVLELRKFCKLCKKHTLHRETK